MPNVVEIILLNALNALMVYILTLIVNVKIVQIIVKVVEVQLCVQYVTMAFLLVQPHLFVYLNVNFHALLVKTINLISVLNVLQTHKRMLQEYVFLILHVMLMIVAQNVGLD